MAIKDTDKKEVESVKSLIPPFYASGKTLVETRLSDRLPEDFVKGIKNREDFDTFHAWLKSVPVSDRSTGRALPWDEKNKRERERMSNAVAYIKRTRFPDVIKHDKGKTPSVKETPEQIAKKDIAEQAAPSASALETIEAETISTPADIAELVSQVIIRVGGKDKGSQRVVAQAVIALLVRKFGIK